LSTANDPARPAQKTYSFAELRTLQFPPENHIIGNGLLSRNSIMVIAAPPKSLKSFTLNTIIMQLLTGEPLFGVSRSHARRVEYLFPIAAVKRVLLIEQEIGLQDTQSRLLDLAATLTPEHQALVDQGFFIRSCDYDLRLDSILGLQRIRAIIDEIRPDIVCIDPLTKFHTSEENSPSEMGRIMLALRQIIHTFNTTLIILHHTGKNEEGKEGLDLLRGASSIAGDIDTGLNLHIVNRPASILWADVVLRRGKPIPSFKLKLNHQTLRTEFYGWTKSKESYQTEAVLSQVQEVTKVEQ